MKNLLILIICIVPGLLKAQEDFSIRAGAGYAHDFPGMNGYGVFAEISKPLSEKLQGSFGVKTSNLNGYPRTSEVNEFTKATSIEFGIYFLPLSNEQNQVRIGAGYNFSFYKIRRSFPLTTHQGANTVTNWPVQEGKGRVSGVTINAEYEYLFPGTNFSLGLRGSLYKAYDHVLFGGGFVGWRL